MDSPQTDLGGGVVLADGAQSAAAEGTAAVEARRVTLAESCDPGANLFKRLWRIEQELEAVEKSQTAQVKMEGGGSYSYKYSGHDLILAYVRPLLAKHGVKFLPTTLKHERTGNLTMLTVGIQFINVDDPEDRTVVEVVNYGADKGDKGATKALTNAVREALKKAFNITSEDDKIADEHTDFQSDDGASRADIDKAHEVARAALEKWATAFREALKNAQTVDDVKRLERDNREQLTSPGLPAVTRTFFAEAIETRKRELAAG